MRINPYLYYSAALGSYYQDELGLTMAFMILKFQYTKPKRAYHSWTHIDGMLRLYFAHEAAIEDKETVLLAILYHDAVYDVSRTDNELESANFFVENVHPNVATERVEKVKNYIYATKKHDYAGDDMDLNYFLDFDLAILGTTPANYRKYTEKIRVEYDIYPDALYYAGRKAIMESFLARKSIYKTRMFKDLYEEKARMNIQRELEELEVMLTKA